MLIRRPYIGLPRTGETAGATPTTWFPLGCDSDYQAGQPNATRFIDNGNGTISDRVTGLMWPKDPIKMIPGAVGITADNLISSAAGAWSDATTYSAGAVVTAEANVLVLASGGAGSYANNVTPLTLDPAGATAADIGRSLVVTGDGAGTYRIVARVDATHIVVYGNASAVSVASAMNVYGFFVSVQGNNTNHDPGTDDGTYWRETKWTASAANLTTPAAMQWSSIAVTTSEHTAGAYDATAHYGDGTLSKAEGAIEMCENLSFAGYTNWRMPNMEELHSLYNYAASPPVFSGAPVVKSASSSDIYWAGTSRGDGNPQSSHRVSFGSLAPVNVTTKITACYALPVRGGRLNG